MTGETLAEFTFELHVCRLAERDWPPAGTPPGGPWIVARQLGTRGRRWDTIVIECDPAGFEQRAAFGNRGLDDDLRFVLRNAPETWGWYRDVLPDPGYPWRYVRESIHRAADRGVLETRREGNRIHIRRRYDYPEWIRRIVAIENKPDLDRRAADALARQLEYDVALGLADEVWVATQRRDERVAPALLETMPVEAGILVVDPESLAWESIWNPRSLRPAETGVRILEAGRPNVAGRFEYVEGGEKEKFRRRIAERAWEHGWRRYIDSMRQDCRHFALEADHPTNPPRCVAKGRPQTAAECHGSCDRFEPEPPSWRTRGWPIEGGPGRAVEELLAHQRERYRPCQAE